MKNIAEKKRKESIVEYILYLYRMEDLIRAFDFNMKEIKQYVLSHDRVSEEDRKESYDWFSSLSEEMKAEGIEKEGHLTQTQLKVDELAEIHWQLLKTDPEYHSLHNKTKPFLLDFIQTAGDKNPGHEVQIFLNGLYGMLLSRLNGRKIAPDLMAAATVFGEVLGYLGHAYKEKTTPQSF